MNITKSREDSCKTRRNDAAWQLYTMQNASLFFCPTSSFM